jgi:hypothetical protein
MPEQRLEPAVSSNYRHADRRYTLGARKIGQQQCANSLPVLEQTRRNRVPTQIPARGNRLDRRGPRVRTWRASTIAASRDIPEQR